MNQYQYEDEFFVKAKKYAGYLDKCFLIYPCMLYSIIAMIETNSFNIISIRNQILVSSLFVIIYFVKYFSYQQFKRITILYFHSAKTFFKRLGQFILGILLFVLYFFICSWYLKSNIVCASFCFNSSVIEKIFIFLGLQVGLSLLALSFLGIFYNLEEERNVMREKNILL